MDDRHILQLLLARAEGALEELADRYGRRLYGIAMNILGSPRDAEECVNDTYLALWNAIPPEEPDPLCAYAYRVARNTALNRLRANTAACRSGGYELSLEELADFIPDRLLSDQLEARELGRSIDRFLSTQSRQTRIIFLRRYWFGDSIRQIARNQGLTEGAVSVRLNRARNALRDYLNQEGHSV